MKRELILFPEIIDYAYNERYIVAYQKFDPASLDNDTVWQRKENKILPTNEKTKEGVLGYRQS